MKKSKTEKNALAVTVFCSSTIGVAPVYVKAATELGNAIGRKGWTLVYGGNSSGCMQNVADGARQTGGKVVGITPKLFFDNGIHDTQCKLIIARDMRHRKELLEKHCDAFVALPGGVGTLEEFFECLVGRFLNYHGNPVVLLNVNRFYDPLIRMIKDGIKQKFVRPKIMESFHVAETVSDAIKYLERNQVKQKVK